MPDKGAFQQDPVDTEQTPCLEDLSGERSTQEKKKKKNSQSAKTHRQHKLQENEGIKSPITVHSKDLKSKQRGHGSVQKYGI